MTVAILSEETKSLDLELTFRELAKRSLYHFIRYRFRAEKRKLDLNWHVHYLCELLEAQTRFELPRLMVNMPPRFLKSELASQAWQAWMIGQDDSPDSSMVSASYAATLAARDSAKTLAIIQSPWYQTLFPHVEVDKATEVEWSTVGGAGRVAAGALGPITGKGGMHLLGDDLTKPMDANSEIIRTKTNDWYGEVFRSRLNDQKRGTITIIAQRLHEMDVCGYLINQSKNPDADAWKHVNLPLENYEGRAKLYSFGRVKYLRKRDETLHAKRIGPKEVKALKAAMRSNFEGQYNQRPQKMEGGKLRPALLCRSAKTPQQIIKELGLTVFGYIDLATKEKQRDKDDPDYTAIELWARDQLQRKWLFHVWRRQCSMDEAAGVVLDLHKEWKVAFWKGEKGGLQHAFRSVMSTVCRIRNRSMVPLIDMPNDVDKMQKVAPFEASLNAGVINVCEHSTWLPEFEAEMRSFPKGAHDDMCLVSDTWVLCYDSCKPISQVTTQDKVWTRHGWRRVLWSGQTGISPVITRFGLTGTHNHPVWTENRGWIPLVSVNPEDVLVCVANPSISMGEPITDTQIPSSAASPDISTVIQNGRMRHAHSIGMSGWHAVGRFRQAIMFITRTVLTIIERLPLRYALPSTMGNIIDTLSAQDGLHPGNGQQKTVKLKGTSEFLKIGTNEVRQPGSEYLREKPSLNRRESGIVSVQTAEPLINMRRAGELRKPVPPNVESKYALESGLKKGGPLSTRDTPRNVQYVTCHFWPRILCPSSVERLANKRLPGSNAGDGVPVFNLKIEDCPEFFANGVLVHNCDIAGQACNDLENQAAGDAPMESEQLPKFAITGKMLKDSERRRKALLGGEAEDDYDS